MKTFIATLLVASLFAPSSALAEDPAPPPTLLSTNLDLRITGVEKGSPAPFTGILLTPDSMAKIEYDSRLELSLLKNKHIFESRRLQLKLETQEVLRMSERKMYEEIFVSQLNRIEALEQIAIDKKPDWVLPVAILTSFIVGAGVTVGITYAVNQ